MFLIHGLYNFKPRRVAFRRDFCRTCRAESLAIRVRSFDVLHVFWIPLIPLGFWRRWFCSTCQSPPHDSPVTRPFYRYAAVVFLGLMTFAIWTPMPQAGAWFLWTLRIVLAGLTLWTLVWAVRRRPEPDLARALASVAPFEGWTCPVCGQGEYLNAPGWKCRACGVTHEPLERGA